MALRLSRILSSATVTSFALRSASAFAGRTEIQGGAIAAGEGFAGWRGNNRGPGSLVHWGRMVTLSFHHEPHDRPAPSVAKQTWAASSVAVPVLSPRSIDRQLRIRRRDACMPSAARLRMNGISGDMHAGKRDAVRASRRIHWGKQSPAPEHSTHHQLAPHGRCCAQPLASSIVACRSHSPRREQ